MYNMYNMYMYTFIQWNFYNVDVVTLGLVEIILIVEFLCRNGLENNGHPYMYRVAALIFSKPFVAVFYEFSKPLWLLVCFLIVSTPFASMLGT